jgi:hypothetical protein
MPAPVKTFLMSAGCKDAIRSLDDPATVYWLESVIKSNTFAFGDIIDEGPEFGEPSMIKIGHLRELKIGRSHAMLRVVKQESYPTKLNDIPAADSAEIPSVCSYTLVPTIARVPLELAVANVAYNPRSSLAGTCLSQVESESQSADRLNEEKRQQHLEGPIKRSRVLNKKTDSRISKKHRDKDKHKGNGNSKGKGKGKGKGNGKGKGKGKGHHGRKKHKKSRRDDANDDSSSSESTSSRSSSQSEPDPSSSDDNQSSDCEPEDGIVAFIIIDWPSLLHVLTYLFIQCVLSR